MLFVYDSMPKRSVARDVESKAKARECLICGEVAVVRGLCGRHYENYKTARRKRATKQAKAEYDAALIREGKILGPWQVCELTRQNPFE